MPADGVSLPNGLASVALTLLVTAEQKHPDITSPVHLDKLCHNAAPIISP